MKKYFYFNKLYELSTWSILWIVLIFCLDFRNGLWILFISVNVGITISLAFFKLQPVSWWNTSESPNTLLSDSPISWKHYIGFFFEADLFFRVPLCHLYSLASFVRHLLDSIYVLKFSKDFSFAFFLYKFWFFVCWFFTKEFSHLATLFVTVYFPSGPQKIWLPPLVSSFIS